MITFDRHNYRGILETLSMPIDMAQSLRLMFRDLKSQEWDADYDVVMVEGQPEPRHYLFVRQGGRGAVSVGGGSVWGDASSMEDLKRRWDNYDTEWVE